VDHAPLADATLETGLLMTTIGSTAALMTGLFGAAYGNSALLAISLLSGGVTVAGGVMLHPGAHPDHAGIDRVVPAGPVSCSGASTSDRRVIVCRTRS